MEPNSSAPAIRLSASASEAARLVGGALEGDADQVDRGQHAMDDLLGLEDLAFLPGHRHPEELGVGPGRHGNGLR